MKVVVTGGTGLTGRALVSELVRRGHRVISTTRRPDRAGEIAAAGAIPDVVDWADASSLRRVAAGSDALVHVAGIVLGDTVAASGLEAFARVLAVSTAAIYSRHQRSRERYRRNEDAIRAAAPQALFIRPTMIYGSMRDRNVHRVIAFARRWRVLPLPGEAHALIQPVHYADLATAIAALLETDAWGVVDAGGPVPITLEGAARAIFAALRMPARFIPVPVSAALPVARTLDGATGSRWAELLERTQEDRVVDNARLIELTGLAPRSFDAGVRDEVAAMERTFDR